MSTEHDANPTPIPCQCIWPFRSYTGNKNSMLDPPTSLDGGQFHSDPNNHNISQSWTISAHPPKILDTSTKSMPIQGQSWNDAPILRHSRTNMPIHHQSINDPPTHRCRSSNNLTISCHFITANSVPIRQSFTNTMLIRYQYIWPLCQ